MQRKETFKEYVDRTNATMANLEKIMEDEKLKEQQSIHQMERVQNFTEYQVRKNRKARNHRLITKGAAIESVCRDTELLDESEFYSIVEEIFSDPNLQKRIAARVVGRREIADEKEQELQETIDVLKEAGYWKKKRKE